VSKANKGVGLWRPKGLGKRGKTSNAAKELAVKMVAAFPIPVFFAPPREFLIPLLKKFVCDEFVDFIRQESFRSAPQKDG
jgi:hypothetical protein